jgi:hypothetical protein
METLRSMLQWGNGIGNFLFRVAIATIVFQLVMFLYLVNSTLIRALYYPAPAVQECVEQEEE